MFRSVEWFMNTASIESFIHSFTLEMPCRLFGVEMDK